MTNSPYAQVHPMTLPPPVRPIHHGLVRPEDEQKITFLKEKAQSIAGQDPFGKWVEQLSENDLAPILRADGRSAQDFLLKQAANIGKAIPDHLVVVFVTMAYQWGWDPQRLLTADESFHSSRESEISRTNESFLEWLTVHQGAGSTSLPKGQQWPTHAQEFHAFDAQHSPKRDQEWLCAWVVASGANPWTLEWGRSYALQNALTCGHPAIALQLLSLPGAPVLWQALNENLLFNSEQTLIQHLMEGNRGHSLDPKADLSWVVEHVLGTSDINLGNETAESLSLLLIERLEESQEAKNAARRCLQDSWQKKLHKKEVSPREHVGKLALLPENAHWKDQERSTAEGLYMVDLMLNAAWGKPMDRQRDCDPNPTVDVAWFLQRHPNPCFPDLSWTPLTARALRHLVSHDPNRQGIQEFPWSDWSSTKNHLGQSISQPPATPVFACSLNENIANTLSTQGLWFLIFMGKETQTRWRFEAERLASEHLDRSCLEQEALLFGIDDWETFARTGMKPAVEITEWILNQASGSPGEENVRMTLVMAWAQAFYRFPCLIGENQASLLCLLRTLSPGQVTTWKIQKGEILWAPSPLTTTGVWNRFMWILCEHPSMRLSDVESSEPNVFPMLKTELLLTMHIPEKMENLVQRALEYPQHADRIRQWATQEAPLLLEKHGSNFEFLLKPEHIKQVQLSLSLPQSSHGVSKERF